MKIGRQMQSALLLVATAIPVYLARTVLIVEQDVTLAFSDLRGLFSDLWITLLVFVLLSWVIKHTRAGAATLLVIWCLFNFGNYEHISTLGSSADISQAQYLFDKTFFLGSVLSLSSPILLIFTLLGAIACFSLALKFPNGKMRLWPITIVATLALVILAQFPLDSNALNWRQSHVVPDNLARILSNGQEDYLADLSPEDAENLRLLYARDLQGTPIVQLSSPPTNVLLVLLEGISGVHLPTMAAANGIDNAVKLEHLDSLANANLAYSTFIAHNRQTNRGEYAILCGDLPVLVDAEPKMTRALSEHDLTCLPHILNQAGYQTVYLQAAPMGFMSKDSFMPKAGFKESYGEHWFPMSYARNQWGIDDRSFLIQSTDKIRQLQELGKPWFLTLLTVGTHHPYIVPPELGGGNFPLAAQYLDSAVAAFVEKITEMGVLQDTLVIFTSDESVGISGYRGAGKFNKKGGFDDVTKKIVDNWGFLVALLPGHKQGMINEPFAQVDIALSIIDYLGLTAERDPFIGRSIFRSYKEPRPMVFGNVYKKYLGVFGVDGELQLCRPDLSQACDRFSVARGAPFSPERESLGADAEGGSLLAAVVASSESRKLGNRRIALSQEKIVPLLNTPGMQVLFGGQYLSTNANSKISVNIDVSLEGLGGTAQFSLVMKSYEGTYFSKSFPPLQIGERLILAFDYYSPYPLDKLAVTGTVFVEGGDDLQLSFSKASLEITEMPAGEEIFVSELSVTKAEILAAE